MEPRQESANAATGSPSSDITRLFVSWRRGDPEVFDELFKSLYHELHLLAHRQRSRARPGETMRTTVLVHEAYMRLVDGKQIGVSGREHFLALAARVMRNILVDQARAHAAQKRGGELRQVELDEALAADAPAVLDLLAVNAALERLATMDARQAEVAQMRVFGGMSLEEVAAVLDVSIATIKRDWRKARMFLAHELSLGPAE